MTFASPLAAAGPPSIRLIVAEGLPWVVDVSCEWRDGAAWVAGPTRAMRRHVARAPITLYATNADDVELSITPNWSLWTEHGSPGRTALVNIGRTLLADGWRVDHARLGISGIRVAPPTSTTPSGTWDPARPPDASTTPAPSNNVQ